MQWVRLVPITAQRDASPSALAEAQVVFDVTPTVSESRTANYTPIQPIHLPGGIQVYQGTSSRQFEVGVKLISRSSQDAELNAARLQKLRAWQLPYFGATDTLSDANKRARSLQAASGNTLATLTPEERMAEAQEQIRQAGSQLRGAPPDVLYFYAYSADSSGANGSPDRGATANINRVPVVLTSMTVQYPDDVAYIPMTTPSGRVEPFPVLMTISLTLVETHSPRDFERFDLNAYKLGTLAGF